MLIDFIVNTLYISIVTLDDCPVYLSLNKSNIRIIFKTKEALSNVECTEVVKRLVVLTHAGKHINPLDKAVFHEWKQQAK